MAYSAHFKNYNGISGIDWSAQDSTLYFVSDCDYALYKTLLIWDVQGGFKFGPGVDTLAFDAALVNPNVKSNLESVRLGKQGVIWFSVEQNDATFLLKGHLTQNNLEIADTIQSLHKNKLKGNTGIEAVTLSNDHLWYAIERPYQESTKQGTHPVEVQFFKINQRKPHARVVNTFWYPLQPMEAFENNKKSFEDNGVSEALAVNDDTLIIIERGWSPATGTFIRLFEGKTSSHHQLEKTLLFDLNENKETLCSLLTSTGVDRKGKSLIDNYEAMCFGPDIIDNGKKVKTLILVSDNNQCKKSNNQHTDLLIFKTNIPTALTDSSFGK